MTKKKEGISAKKPAKKTFSFKKVIFENAPIKLSLCLLTWLMCIHKLSFLLVCINDALINFHGVNNLGGTGKPKS